MTEKQKIEENIVHKVKIGIESNELNIHNTIEEVRHSNRTFDSLIVVISGGGIYTVLESIKYVLSEDEISVNLTCLKASGVLFLFVIIINLLTQISTVNAGNIAIQIGKKNLDDYKNYLRTENPSFLIQTDEEKSNSNKVNRHNKIIHWSNIISIAFILIAIFSLIFFFWNIAPTQTN
ncbi:hypothetical protein ACFQ5N_06400 [Lutibacter holmesii]|uniref:Uncharacterized protein n=1 Tax=Lutibacter holmesii TaxID=1137985 RepID=A0ABW3WNH4_9FLAO